MRPAAPRVDLYEKPSTTAWRAKQLVPVVLLLIIE